MKEIHNKEELYKILKDYTLEISTAEEFIIHYMETTLRYLAHRLWTEKIQKVEITTYNGKGEIIKEPK